MRTAVLLVLVTVEMLRMCTEELKQVEEHYNEVCQHTTAQNAKECAEEGSAGATAKCVQSGFVDKDKCPADKKQKYKETLFALYKQQQPQCIYDKAVMAIDAAHAHANAAQRARHVREPRQIIAVHNPKLDQQQREVNAVLGQKAMALPLHIRGHYHVPAEPSNLLQFAQLLMSTENAVHVQYQPNEESPRELTIRASGEHFRKAAQMQLPDTPQLHNFYAQQFHSSSSCNSDDSVNAANCEENDASEQQQGENAGEQYISNDNQQQQLQHQQQLNSFISAYKPRQQYAHALRLNAQTSGGARDATAHANIQAQCDERMRYCTVQADANANQQWTLSAQAQVVMPDTVPSVEQLQQSTMLKQFIALAKAQWGDLQDKQHINVRIRGTQAHTEQTRAMMTQIQQQQQDKRHGFSAQQQRKMLQRSAFLNQFHVEATYALKAYAQNMMNRGMELFKSAYFWNTKSQLLSGPNAPKNGKIAATISIDPLQPSNANVTIRTPAQQLHMQQIRMPAAMGRPFALIRQQSAQQTHSLAQLFYKQFSLKSRAQCIVDGQNVDTFDGFAFTAPLSSNCFSVLAKHCSSSMEEQQQQQPQIAATISNSIRSLLPSMVVIGVSAFISIAVYLFNNIQTPTDGAEDPNEPANEALRNVIEAADNQIVAANTRANLADQRTAHAQRVAAEAIEQLAQADQRTARAEEEKRQAEEEKRQAEEEKRQAEEEKQRMRRELGLSLMKNFLYDLYFDIDKIVDSADREAFRSKCMEFSSWTKTNPAATDEEVQEKTAEIRAVCGPIIDRAKNVYTSSLGCMPSGSSSSSTYTKNKDIDEKDAGTSSAKRAEDEKNAAGNYMTKSPIVVAGGGLIGLSVAYGLAKRGAKEVFLFERHCIGAHNSTRISTGMINNPCFYTDRSLQSVVRKSHELYAELDSRGTLGFTRCGRVYLASSDDTAIQARRMFSRLSADPANSAAELVDCPSEMLSRWPMVATEDVKLALFSPLDATIDVQSLCCLLSDRCREMGVHIHETVGVKRVLLNERRTTYAVDTDEGFLETGAFVNAAGIWAGLVEVPELPDRQVRLAAHPCAYTFLSNDALPGIAERVHRRGAPFPIFIAMDENVYLCPTEFRTVSGGFVERDLNALTLPTQTKGAPEWHIPAPRNLDTDEGFLETGAFVNAAGIWAGLVEVPELPDRQVRLAAHPCAYTFLSNDALPGIAERVHRRGAPFPIFIAMDENVYLCPTEFRTVSGGFVERDLNALTLPTQTKGAPEWHIPAPSWDNFAALLRHLLNRFPLMTELSRGSLISGAEMYTPDIRPLIGESDQARGYFIINGMNAQGLSFAGGLGDLLAQWVLEGRPPVTTQAVVDKLDVSRFLPLHANPQYLFQRVPEVASNIYKNFTASHQCHTARNLRTSPIHRHLRDAGAVFAENMGYERPIWYDFPAHSPDSSASSDFNEPRTHRQALFASQDPLVGKPNWFPMVAREYEACRESVGIIDMTSFAKFDISGPDVVPLLQKLCSANIDRAVGTTIYTGMHNEQGGYVSDATVSRMGNDSYFIVAPTVQQVRLALWIQRWADEWAMDVRLQDVTNNFIALDIVGPASRDLMRALTSESVTPHDFPSFAFRTIHLGLVGPIRAISVSHCGELGWMLYIPNELVLNAYEQLVDVGVEYSLRHCGYYALRHLRIEKFYVYWGQDIDSMTTPVECGRVFRVDFEKEFIGKEALNRQLERGVSKRFVQLLVDGHDMDRDPWPHGDEPIYRDGTLAGWTTTAAYGFTLGCQVCLGYVQNEQFGVSSDYLLRGSYEVELAGKRFPCRINLHSPSLPMISSEHPQHYRPTQ
ncbi:hypothetical protein niasHT_019576 [Heterodera trifolii]|uniref:Pyruvate dehydrogenase phosphatase regulatory subunit, mitochondrial n=1 Tax=Heterodera trifolii TaxID=157864 RepID=A0ABD2L801_9BILA